MSHLRHAAYGTALILLLGVGSTASHAASMSVRYSDLALDRPADVKTLYQRIETAAGRVCGPREEVGSHLVSPSYLACYDTAIRQAVESVANPALSAYYQTQPGHAPIQSAALAKR